MLYVLLLGRLQQTLSINVMFVAQVLNPLWLCSCSRRKKDFNLYFELYATVL